MSYKFPPQAPHFGCESKKSDNIFTALFCRRVSGFKQNKFRPRANLAPSLFALPKPIFSFSCRSLTLASEA